MSTFPGAVPSYSTMDPNQTLSAAGHTARHNAVQDDVSAIAAKVGTGVATPAAGKVLRGSGAGSSTWGAVDVSTDITGTLPLNNGGLGVSTLADFKTTFLSLLYPVGSVYTNANVSTNPGTLLGFGTWVAFGQGRVMVGLDSSQTEFDTAEETGGEKTHVLTSAEVPNKTGTIILHNQAVATVVAGATGVFSSGGTNVNAYFAQAPTTNGANSIGVVNFDNGGGGGSHNNLQPYVTVYTWKRTA